MSGLFIFGVIFLAVVCMVIAISKFNMHPFLVLTVIAVLVGLVCGIPTEEVISTVKSGFGNILASNWYRNPGRNHYWNNSGKNRCGTHYGKHYFKDCRKRKERSDHGHHRLHYRYSGFL